MSALVDAIASHLTTAGVVTAQWPAHKLGVQHTPDQSITIYETGGPEPEQAADRRWLRPTFQVVARAAVGDAQAANLKAMAALTALDRATVSGFAYVRATQSAPFQVGPDPNGRPLFSVNFRAGES